MNEKISREMMEFIKSHPSSFHVADGLAQILSDNGFERLYENEKWKLQKGRDYYVMRNGSSLIAFRIPEGEVHNFQMVASHSDSPSFKIKENPEMVSAGHYVELNAEKYGGMLCAPWFDRPLSIAGRVMVRADGGVKQRLINFDRDLVMIPNLAIHMDRNLNDGYKYNAQKDMIPIWGDEASEGSFDEMVAAECGASKEDVVSTDLFLYNRMPGTVWGAQNEYISSPHLDDVQCAYASVKAMLKGHHRESISVCCVFDNEEVGSGTKQGAGSTFGADVLKYNVAQKYTTDARSAAPEKAAYIYAGQIRDELGSRLDLLEKNAYRFCYINDFPMSGTAQDLMYGAPSEITEQQLREVHIKVRD